MSPLAPDEGALYRWRARVLHAAPTGAIPANPPHGPWRRLRAQAEEADIRMATLPQLCGNGLDDDLDGLADFPADPGCTSVLDDNEREAGGPACDDGSDNDGDQRSDYPMDPGCANASSALEKPACQDGLDNDGQPGIDFDGGDSLDLDDNGFIDAAFNPATPAVGAPDPQCTAAWKNKEHAPGCGLGVELVFLLPALVGLRVRRAIRPTP